MRTAKFRKWRQMEQGSAGVLAENLDIISDPPSPHHSITPIRLYLSADEVFPCLSLPNQRELVAANSPTAPHPRPV